MRKIIVEILPFPILNYIANLVVLASNNLGCRLPIKILIVIGFQKSDFFLKRWINVTFGLNFLYIQTHSSELCE